MELQPDRMEISVRLLTSGRYIWTILLNTESKNTEGSIQILKLLDKKLQDQFPNFPRVGTGRVKDLEE